MTDEPRIPKPSLSRFKGLPPWAYVAAIGIGGGAVWYGLHRANANATSTAADISGIDPSGGTLSATTAGDAYPTSSQGAAPYYDPTTGVTNPDSHSEFDDFANFLQVIGYPGGGGTQSSAAPEDHYTPPSITINIPPSAIPVAPTQSTPASKPAVDNCKGEYPNTQTVGTRKGLCFKNVTKNGKKYRFYANGDKVLVD